MNEQIGKAVVGGMLKRSREANGYAQRDVAMTLGLLHSNYLSMIEKGTHAIPLKRIWDFVSAYRLSNEYGLAVAKMTNFDAWGTILKGVEACGVPKAKVAALTEKIDEIIITEARLSGIEAVGAIDAS